MNNGNRSDAIHPKGTYDYALGQRTYSSLRLLEKPPSAWFNLLIVLLLVVPIYGTFYPFETYLMAGGEEGAGLRGGIPYTPVMLVLISIASIFLYFRIRRDQRVTHEFLAYLFVAIAFVSCGWSGMLMPSFQRALRLLPAVALGVLIAQSYNLQRTLRLMTVAFLISALACILMVVLYPGLGLSKLGNGYENAWRGAMVQKNFTGFTFALGMVVTCYAWFLRSISKALALVTLTLCTFVMVMSDSATSILALIGTLAAVLWMNFLQRMPFRLRPIFIVVTLLAVTASVMMSGPIMDTFVVATGRDMTLTGRTVIWSAVWAQIESSPFLGHGYGIWSSENPVRTMMWQAIGDVAAHSHNSWLDIWLQLGLFGLIALILVVVVASGRALWLLMMTNIPETQFFLAIIILLMIRSVSEVEFTDPSIKGLFWLVWAATNLKILVKNVQANDASQKY